MILKLLKSLIKKMIKQYGYEIHAAGSMTSQENIHTMEKAIKRCKERDIQIGSVIDVGASNGSWTELCMKYFPDSYYYLIEAQKPHEPSLKQLKERFMNVDYIISAAGNSSGEIYFDANDLFGGLASEQPFEEKCICIKVPVTRIDAIVKEKALIPPFLIKLDTHGFEIPILEGAKESLINANLIIIEAYNFQLTENSLRFYDLCKYMEAIGFLPIDIIDLSLREYDNSFWQMDLFFLPSRRREFNYNKYK